MELILLPAEECRPLRQSVLPEGQAPSDAAAHPDAAAQSDVAAHADDSAQQAAAFGLDDAEGAMHLGLKDGAELLAIASILPDRRDGTQQMWRLRGVVVRPDQRGQGLGAKLVNAMIVIAEERGGGLWCTPPAVARGFLERCGLEALGDDFEVPGRGPHVLMVRGS